MLYLSEKYTTEEISFNHLDAKVYNAIDNLNDEIDKITSTLRKYGFQRKDISKLILDKLK